MRDPDFIAPWAPVHDLVEKLPECDPALELKPVLKGYKLEQLRSVRHTVRLLEHVTGLQGILMALGRFPEAIRIAEAIETTASVPPSLESAYLMAEELVRGEVAPLGACAARMAGRPDLVTFPL